MERTMIEHIFSQNIGKDVRPGEEYLFEPDLCCAYDAPGWYVNTPEFDKLVTELNIKKLKDPSKFLMFIDHFVPAGNSAIQEVHVQTRTLCKQYGVKLYEAAGIGHQVLAEEGYAVPGEFAVHYDTHISMIGALGACGMGVRNCLIEVFATQKIALVVPETFRLDLIGKLQPGVTIRDAFHWLLQEIGPAGCRGMCLEIGGSGLESLDLDDRFTFCNLGMFVSAVTVLMEQDEKVDQFLRDRARKPVHHIAPDPDAIYAKRMCFDLSKVEPILVAPPSSVNTIHLTTKLGMKVDVGYVGSCASGRMKDFHQLLEVLGGKKIADGFRLELIPASVAIQKKLAESGVMSRLIDAGARFFYPSCDTCFGFSCAMTRGEVALSTGTLNLPGRKGCVEADIYTAGPYAIAAAALSGCVTDPRTLF